MEDAADDTYGDVSILLLATVVVLPGIRILHVGPAALHFVPDVVGRGDAIV
jgi:hypothetical protein